MGTKKHSEAAKHALNTSQTRITAATFQSGTVDDKVAAAEIYFTTFIAYPFWLLITLLNCVR